MSIKNHSFNGYYDPYRSKGLLEVLHKLPKKSEPQPGFFETASKANAFKESVLCISILTSLGIMIGLIFAGANLPLGWTLFLVTVALISPVAAGAGLSDLRNKQFWQDPIFRQEKREWIIDSFIRLGKEKATSLHQDQWQQHKLFTKEDIRMITESV